MSRQRERNRDCSFEKHELTNLYDVDNVLWLTVLCGAASYIAVQSAQRVAIPDAHPRLSLAALLGVTFSYNVAIGIPVYIMIATIPIRIAPVVAKYWASWNENTSARRWQAGPLTLFQDGFTFVAPIRV